MSISDPLKVVVKCKRGKQLSKKEGNDKRWINKSYYIFAGMLKKEIAHAWIDFLKDTL